MSSSILIFLAIVIGSIILLASIFNRLVALKNHYLNAFAQIEVQLKRRYDLIPNLVETAKAYLTHEKQTLENVIAARNGAKSALSDASANLSDPAVLQHLQTAENLLSSELGKLNVVVEDYPELKANQNMMQLFEELTSTENKVSFARQAYNDAVMHYNTFRQSFPQNILATAFGHTRDAKTLVFADTKKLKEVPKVAF
jgi:LemA protein